MKKETKNKLTILVAAALGFVIGKWFNNESKERLLNKYRKKFSKEKGNLISMMPDLHNGEVLLDEYEMLSYHK